MENLLIILMNLKITNSYENIDKILLSLLVILIWILIKLLFYGKNET